jgi:hydrogenase-4 component F
MTLVAVSQHFGLLWVAVEATTLSSAPLIYFHRSPRSLEATWKYLLICSVGIALALLGNFVLAVAASGTTAGEPAELTVAGLSALGPALSAPWLKAALIFFLVGYGTKMGLAPMHTWLPDAHSESPSVVSALLSGALLNCAFLAILRVFAVCASAGLAAFAQDILVGFGLLSMGVAAVFILGQRDYKRMLAYSSVEHMGILALGVGIGGAATFGALLHAVNHSVAKALLFFCAGNILAVYRTKDTRDVRGMLRVLPATGVLWVAGFLAITGSPPFGAFMSEFTVLKGALDQGRWLVAAAYLLALGVIFIGMATVALRMAQGEPPAKMGSAARREGWLGVVPPALMAAVALVLGVWVPPALAALLHEIARGLGGM